MAGATTHGAWVNGPTPRKIAIYKYLSNDVGQKFNTTITKEAAEQFGDKAVAESHYEVVDSPSAKL